MNKQGNQQLNIIEPSLSAISHHADHSNASLTGIFEDKKLKDDKKNVQIKVNRPKNEPYSTGLNGQTFDQNYYHNNDYMDQDDIVQPVIQAQQIPLTMTTTGYQICKESFSEEEIIQAFKVIDINKDQVITQEDIIFFLQYIKEPYTMQEVKQMIDMVSSDKKKVTFEDFKKIGKGSIIPFADIKIPDQKNKEKSAIYNNIRNNHQLYKQSPSIMVSASKSYIISHQKFQESKKAPKHNQMQNIRILDQEQHLQFLQKHLLIRSQEDFNRTKQFFNSIQMVNVTQAIKNYLQVNKSYIGSRQIAKILQINEKDAKKLFGQGKILSKRVIMEAVAFSPINKIKRLEFCLTLMNKKRTVMFNQIYHLLQFLKCEDTNESVKKKLLTILKSKNISRNQQIDKFYALEIISNGSYNFSF